MIQIYFGEGKGKTSAAIGAGVRALGRGKKVVIARFLKDNNSGEVLALSRMDGCKIIERPKNVPFYFCASEEEKAVLKETEKKTWREAKKERCDMLILDELLDAADLIGESEIEEFLKSSDSEIVITGHKKIERIFALADYISEIKKEKHPFDGGCAAREGIEY